MIILERLKIGTKILITFLIVGIVPFAVIGSVSLFKSSEALSEQSFEKLKIVQEIKKAQVREYYSRCLGDLTVLSKNYALSEALNRFPLLFDEDGAINMEGYDFYDTRYGDSMKLAVKEYGYNDLLLIQASGRIVYSARKSPDLGLSVLEGPLAESHLGRAFKQGLEGITTTDFHPYAQADNQPIAFILAPIEVVDKLTQETKVTGLVVLKLDNSQLNTMTNRREGMGETGESFLVRKSGGGTYFHTDNKTGSAGDVASLTYLEDAFSQDSGAGTYTENGVKQLISYGKMGLDGLDWVLISKMDQKEAFVAVSQLKTLIGIVAFLGVAAIILVAFFIARSITRPINEIAAGMKDIADGEGDLTVRLEIKGRDELSELSHWFNTFIEKVQEIIRLVSENADKLNGSSTALARISHMMSEGADEASSKSIIASASSEEMSATMQSIAAATEQASTNMNMVASAAEEMTVTISEIAQNSDKSHAITGEAVIQAQNAADKMDTLGTAAREISQVTEVITEISGKINLLALNATIEAARAGDAGRGFAVVANEIKELANQTAQATQEIRSHIEGIQTSTAETADEISQITQVINHVNGIVATIASSVTEQTVTTQEIAGNVAQASTGIQEVNENVAQSSSVSNSIADEISQINRISGETSSSSAQVSNSAEELSALATELSELVGRFKV
ncbi:methyl-accepting chemotaxis protein [Desulfoluna sp.]|uniref:methyl-accepting chemotaxis protein n=1 Tax=Desulfoluna sp. TaxID=2045199 RepID=UPI00260956A4|nr:methyl-accepting chemotaxis protein [Desulfoluna sp.]